jgi:hypothetical protein
MDSNNPIDYEKLRFYTGILEDINDKQKLSYSDLSKNLLETFGFRISKIELIELDEPTVEEMKMDLEIQIKNVC